MSARHGYEYAVLQAVPRPERGESVNVGVLLTLICPLVGEVMMTGARRLLVRVEGTVTLKVY